MTTVVRSSERVTVLEHGNKYALLTPGHYPPRTGIDFQLIGNWRHIDWVIESAGASPLLAVDLETRGTEAYRGREHSDIVGIGLAWNSGSIYFHMTELYPNTRDKLIRFIGSHTGLIAHNVYFDGSFLYRELGRVHPKWLACTYGLYKQLASESFNGQTWGLKDAMIEMLGWVDTNTAELDQWLIGNGYHKANGTKPNKSEMWRAPSIILGQYCVLDAEATYLLFHHVLEPVYRRFPKLVEYHAEYFLFEVRLLIEQRFHGILMDVDKLHQRREELNRDILDCKRRFTEQDEVKQIIGEYENELLQAYIQKEPPRYLKRKQAKEPARYKKDGTPSRSWLAWDAKQREEPVISKNWLNWNDRYQHILAREDPDYKFNIQSGPQLRWLFYTKLGMEINETTETGEPAIGEDALKQMGDVGRALVEYNILNKELSYVNDYINRANESSTLHPGFNIPGTITGRLAGKEPNIQQVPKSRGTMEAFISRPGYVWVDCDVNALEMVVTTELSGDSGLLGIYGPDAPVNDIYLNDGARMPIVGRAIRATGYDPDDPTPASIARAKKEAKHERGIVKTVVLASNYGAGPNKIQRTLRMNGVKLELDQVRMIHRGFWDLHPGITEYQRKLEDEWRANGGWVLNGVGRPICVAEDYKKDLLNRVVQSTGHDILMMYIRIVADLLNGTQENLDVPAIDWKPIIADWHDEMIVEVPEEHGELVAKLMGTTAFNILNEKLGSTIPLKGSACIVTNLADAKLED